VDLPRIEYVRRKLNTCKQTYIQVHKLQHLFPSS